MKNCIQKDAGRELNLAMRKEQQQQRDKSHTLKTENKAFKKQFRIH